MQFAHPWWTTAAHRSSPKTAPRTLMDFNRGLPGLMWQKMHDNLSTEPHLQRFRSPKPIISVAAAVAKPGSSIMVRSNPPAFRQEAWS
ncbi:hypothetical protein [Pararhizobium sp. LjRoot238]|uniref:hypothetical protein n=1 Tax=Pararhizobium sp. LjRoot238 TaxID=3342293 RepID=UPI003ECEA2C4